MKLARTPTVKCRFLMPHKAPQIKDVARVAGVSTATVSRALSQPDMLTDATREAVFEAVRATGYRVNKAARALRKQSANAVLVLVPNLGNPFFSQILSGISQEFAKSEVSVLITDANNRPREEQKLVDYFLDGRVDGMISLDGGLGEDELSLLVSEGFADRITQACEWIEGADLPSVRSDNFKGAQLAIRHLYDLGHRKIAHITGPADNVLTHSRRRGVLSERERLSLPVRPDWIIRGDFSLVSGRMAAGKIAAMEDRPTAVFCAADEVALGLIAGLNALGVRVPEDISVVGFDGLEQAEHFVPALTTIVQDRIALGRKAALMLKAQLSGAAIPRGTIELVDVALVARASSAAVR